jgi:outer membrane protein OmpA-like peptidoglycan-associated protein
MKKNTITLIAMLVVMSGMAYAGGKDTDNTPASEWSLNMNVAALDFYSPMLKNFSSFKERMAFGPDLTIQRNYFKTGIGISINFMAPGGLSTKTNPDLPALNKHLLMIGPGLVYNFQNAYMLKSSFPVAPFIFANALGAWVRVPENGSDDKFGLSIPIGAGLNFKVSDGVSLNVKGGYMFGVTEYFDNNIYWSAGIGLGLGRVKTDEPTPVVFEPVIVDTDGDGIPDELDRCPNEAGTAELQGCPDRDGDGVADIDDPCPDEAGPASNQGCPVVEEPVKTAPVEATPTQEAPKPQKPVEQPQAKVELKSSPVQFASEKADLSAEAKQTLDQLAALLKANQEQRLIIEGHADNTGGEALNKQLSAKRAKACADYLISIGVEKSRITTQSFSSNRPIADNSSPEGRALNRRAAFIFSPK